MRCSRPSGRERPEQELRQCARRVDPVVAVEPPPRLGERGEHQPVPGGDRLVVAERLRAQVPRREQHLPLLVRQPAAQDGPAVLERPQQRVAARPDHGGELVRRPRERQSLDAVRVCVLRRREAAALEGELAQDVGDGVLDDRAIVRRPGEHPRVQVRGDEERVVVEHLLEVRDEPLPVDGIAVEAAADEVVHPARGHPVERAERGLELAAAQQELDRRRGRELRCVPEAAPLRIELRAERGDRVVQQLRRQRLRRRLLRRTLPERVDEHRRLPRDVVAPVAVRLRDGAEHLQERRHPVPRLGRVVRAAEERLAVRRDEHRHRPAALSGERDDRVHVDRVDVGPLLAVDLHADEMLVHHPRGRVVLERLPLHHVAPVARGVADRDEQRLVLGTGARERLVAPRVPVDGIARMLQEVRARLIGEAVHLLTATLPARATIARCSRFLPHPRAGFHSSTSPRSIRISASSSTARPARSSAG